MWVWEVIIGVERGEKKLKREWHQKYDGEPVLVKQYWIESFLI